MYSFAEFLSSLAKGNRSKVGQKYIIWYWVGLCVIALWGKFAHANLFACDVVSCACLGIIWYFFQPIYLSYSKERGAGVIKHRYTRGFA